MNILRRAFNKFRALGTGAEQPQVATEAKKKKKAKHPPKNYRRVYLPKISGGVATLPSGARYAVSKSGWRRI